MSRRHSSNCANFFASHGTVGNHHDRPRQGYERTSWHRLVELTQVTEAEGAISALDGTMLNGRPMSVNEARPSFLEIRGVIRGAEMIGDAGCELRTRKLPLDSFSAAYEMDSL